MNKNHYETKLIESCIWKTFICIFAVLFIITLSATSAHAACGCEDSGYYLKDRVLIISGTDGPDYIKLSDDNGSWKLQIDFNGAGEEIVFYDKSDVDSVVIHGCDGDDEIRPENLDIPTTVYGGAGKDHIHYKGKDSIDTVYGGGDKDTIHGTDKDDYIDEDGPDGADCDPIIPPHACGCDNPGYSLEDGVLIIEGTNGPDKIKVKEDKGGWKVEIELDGMGKEKLWFDKSEFDSVLVYGCAGDDEIRIEDLDIPSTIYGGAGDDHVHIKGDDAIEIVYGGDGKDKIHGAKNDDFVDENGPDEEECEPVEPPETCACSDSGYFLDGRLLTITGTAGDDYINKLFIKCC